MADAANPELAPDGSSILFIKDGQILSREAHARETRQRSGSRREAVHHANGASKAIRSGRRTASKIAFVSTRTDHSFIVVYDVATRTVKYMSPSVDFDTMPHVARRQQASDLHAPARVCLSASRRSRAGRHRSADGLRSGRRRARLRLQRPWRRTRRPRQTAATATPPAPVNNTPGLMRATFKGGYTLAFYKADVTTGDAQETWHNQPNDTLVPQHRERASGRRFVVFPFNAGGGRGGRGGAAQCGAARAGNSGRRPRNRLPTNGNATTP